MIKLQKTRNKRLLITLPIYKLGFAHLSAYLMDSANVNFGKCHSAYKLLTKENEQFLPTKCAVHLVDKAARKECDVLTCNNEVS